MIAACLKWVDRRPELDANGRPATPDTRFAGVSAADQAALEWALRCRDAWPDEQVTAISVGPPAADAVLGDALAAGADLAVRVDAPFGGPSPDVAHALAAALPEASLVFCGDYSFDRGTGSVPAFLAHHLRAAQALGLVEVVLGPHPGTATALRRLDGGRRDRLSVTGPAVLSVEGSTALLRRAPLRSLLARRSVTVVTPASMPAVEVPAVSRPYRPRPRALPAPAGANALDRVRSLIAAGAAPPLSHGDPVVLDPEAAADRILAALVEWQYLDES